MKFQQNNRPLPYLNARDQRRLLLLVGVLAVVIISIEFAARPSTWYWLTGPPHDETDIATNQSAKKINKSDIDARLDRPGNPLPEGGFRVVAAVVPDNAPTAPAENDPARLDPLVFEAVKDDSLGVRSSERGAYFQTLARARDLSQNMLQTRASSEVTFAQMFTDPDDYRGRLITIKGRVKRLHPVAAVKNDFGITTIYEAWIITVDSGDNPLLLHCTEIPDGIPTGQDLDLPCRFTGYFFKKYAYAAVHGLHSTTMLLGKRLQWTPPPKTTGMGLAPYILGIVLAMAGMTALVLWRYSVSDRRSRQAHLDRMANVDLTDLNEGVVPPN